MFDLNPGQNESLNDIGRMRNVLIQFSESFSLWIQPPLIASGRFGRFCISRLKENSLNDLRTTEHVYIR